MSNLLKYMNFRVNYYVSMYLFKNEKIKSRKKIRKKKLSINDK